MIVIHVQFADETETVVMTVFGCVQGPEIPNQGEIEEDDPRYLSFLESRLPSAKDGAESLLLEKLRNAELNIAPLRYADELGESNDDDQVQLLAWKKICRCLDSRPHPGRISPNNRMARCTGVIVANSHALWISSPPSLPSATLFEISRLVVSVLMDNRVSRARRKFLQILGLGVGAISVDAVARSNIKHGDAIPSNRVNIIESGGIDDDRTDNTSVFMKIFRNNPNGCIIEMPRSSRGVYFISGTTVSQI